MRRRLGSLLLVAGLLLMAWPVMTWTYGVYWQTRLSARFQARETAARIRRLASDHGLSLPLLAHRSPHRVGLAAAVLRKRRRTPLPPPWPREDLLESDAVARLRIPRIGLDALVVEGTDPAALRRGPGHVPGTGLPGEDQNCAIAAHRDGWFARLDDIQPGDLIWLETPDGVRYKYQAAHEQTVTPDRRDLLNRGPYPVLTLITCTGPGYPHSRYRLLVYCHLVGAFPAG